MEHRCQEWGYLASTVEAGCLEGKVRHFGFWSAKDEPPEVVRFSANWGSGTVALENLSCPGTAEWDGRLFGEVGSEEMGCIL
jgi:hypothetical protein